MAEKHFKPPQELDFNNPKWGEWIKAFEMYRVLTGLDKKEEEIQV